MKRGITIAVYDNLHSAAPPRKPAAHQGEKPGDAEEIADSAHDIAEARGALILKQLLTEGGKLPRDGLIDARLDGGEIRAGVLVRLRGRGGEAGAGDSGGSGDRGAISLAGTVYTPTCPPRHRRYYDSRIRGLWAGEPSGLVGDGLGEQDALGIMGPHGRFGDPGPVRGSAWSRERHCHWRWRSSTACPQAMRGMQSRARGPCKAGARYVASWGGFRGVIGRPCEGPGEQLGTDFL